MLQNATSYRCGSATNTHGGGARAPRVYIYMVVIVRAPRAAPLTARSSGSRWGRAADAPAGQAVALESRR